MRMEWVCFLVFVLSLVLSPTSVVAATSPRFEVAVSEIRRDGVIEAEVLGAGIGCVGCAQVGDHVRFELAGARFPEVPRVIGHLIDVLAALFLDRVIYLELAPVSTGAISEPWAAYAYLQPNGCLPMNAVLLSTGLLESDFQLVASEYLDTYLAFDLVRLRAALRLSHDDAAEGWVRVENLGRIPIDISGWRISDATDCWVTAPFAEGTILNVTEAITINVSVPETRGEEAWAPCSPGMLPRLGCTSPFSTPLLLRREVKSLWEKREQIVLALRDH